MSNELQVKVKNHLVLTSLNEEGLLLDLDTRKSFWINETAAFLLKLFETNCGGVRLSSARDALQEQYLADDGSKVAQDFASFINQLEGFDLVSLRSPSNGTNVTKLTSPNGEAKRSYLKPMIKEEADTVLSVQGSMNRAARMSNVRSQAVRSATNATFRGFR